MNTILLIAEEPSIVQHFTEVLSPHFAVRCVDSEAEGRASFDADNAVRMARRLSEQVERAFRGDRLEGRETLSIGIAVSPANGETFEGLFQSADAALYHVKAHGRAAIRMCE